MRSKGDEDKHDGDEEAGGDPGDRLTDGVELDPAQDGDLDEEHEDPKYSGEAPGELHYEVHLHVRRLENSLLSLKEGRCQVNIIHPILSSKIHPTYKELHKKKTFRKD